MKSRIAVLGLLAALGCQEIETVDRARVTQVLEANKPEVQQHEKPLPQAKYTSKPTAYVPVESIEQFCEAKVNDALTTCAKEGTIHNISVIFDKEKAIQMGKCKILAKYRGRETAEKYSRCVESICGKLEPSPYSVFKESRLKCDERFT